MTVGIKNLYVVRGILKSPRRWKHFITTPIFYANGPPHIGHLYSALLADTSHRWELLKDGLVAPDDEKYFFSTGTDEHGLKIQRTAKAAGCDPQSYCDNISNKFRDLLRDFYIQPNIFIRTTETRHKEVVEHVWKELEKRGQIQKGKYEGWYSMMDECFYTNDEVQNLTEQGCMISKVTGSPVEWVQEENYVFPLPKYLGSVRNWLNSNDVIYPTKYLPLALQQANAEENLSLSRDRKRVSWGIAVPNDDSQTVYVWFDALMNYLTVCGFFSNNKRTFWPPTCQIVGKDILKFHAVIWPAFLLALDLPLPKRIFVHSHWLVDGAKMSKSVGNVVDPFVAAKSLTAEGLRYFLLRQGTPQNDANFMMLKAVNVINTDLVNNIGNLLQRSLVEKLNPTQTYPNFFPDLFRDDLLELGGPLVESLSSLPVHCGTLESFLLRTHGGGRGAHWSSHHPKNRGTRTSYQKSKQMDDLMVYKALEILTEVVKHANGFFQFYEPWKELDDKKVSSLLYVCCEVLRICGILLQPSVPHYASRLLNRLGIDRSERALENAKFMTDSKYFGRRLGKYDGPIMGRIVWKEGDKLEKRSEKHL